MPFNIRILFILVLTCVAANYIAASWRFGVQLHLLGSGRSAQVKLESQMHLHYRFYQWGSTALPHAQA